MIFTIILNIVYWFLGGVVAVLGAIPAIPDEAFSALAWFMGLVGDLSLIFPFETLFRIVGLQIIIYGVIAGWDWLNWGINKMRGSGT